MNNICEVDTTSLEIALAELTKTVIGFTELLLRTTESAARGEDVDPATIRDLGDAVVHLGDCLELIKHLPNQSVDMILCDLPYGTTACKWDSVIPFEQLWDQYRRVAKPNAAIVLTAAQPFTTALIASNMREFAYCWVWDKKFAANFVQAKRMPLRVHEDVVVFCTSGKTPRYYPQMTPRDKPIKKGGNKQSAAIPIRQTETAAAFSVAGKTYDEKCPETIIEFSCREGRGLHPTQKPVALMEYLIRTYTQEGDTVLDNCMGSGTTGIAAALTGRKFIGMEKDEGYFEIAVERIEKAISETTQCQRLQ